MFEHTVRTQQQQQQQQQRVRESGRTVEGELGSSLRDGLRRDAPDALALGAACVLDALLEAGEDIVGDGARHGAERVRVDESHERRDDDAWCIADDGGDAPREVPDVGGVAHVPPVRRRCRAAHAAPHTSGVVRKEDARVAVARERVESAQTYFGDGGEHHVRLCGGHARADARLRLPEFDEFDPFDARRMEAVGPPPRSDDVAHGGADDASRAHHVVLHGLVHAPRDVPRLGRLDGGVDEALAPSDGVEEELGGAESQREGVLHHPPARERQVVVRKAREGPRPLVGYDAPSLETLLPERGADLREVYEGPLRPRGDHAANGVGGVHVLVDDASGLQECLGQEAHDGVLALLPLVGGAVHDLALYLLAERRRLLEAFRDARVSVGTEHHVVDPDVVSPLKEELVRDALRVPHEAHAGHSIQVAADDVDDSPRARADVRLAQNSRQQSSVAHRDGRIDPRVRCRRIEVREHRVRLHVEFARKDDRKDLPPRPQRAARAVGGADPHRGGWKAPRGVADVPHDAARVRVVEEDVALRQEIQAEETVLHDAHDGFVGLGPQRILRDRHERGAFRARHLALRNVQVHLVAVEVGVVRRRNHEREAKGVTRHEAHAVRLHSVHVETRLPVEDDDVVVGEEALHDVSGAQHDRVAVSARPEVGDAAVCVDDVPRAAHVGGADADAFGEMA